MKINQRYGGIELVKDSGRLPTKAPILWREKQRRQLGQLRYQVRYLVVVEILAIGVPLLTFHDSFRHVTLFVWMIGSVILIAQASNLVVNERLSQSLEILMTTPLSGAAIVVQKARSMVPLLIVIAAPILTLTAMQVLSDWLIGERPHLTIYPLLHEALHLLIFLPLFLTIGLAVGLGARSRVAAMMRAIGIIVLWCAIPVGFLWEAIGTAPPFNFHLPYLTPTGVITGHSSFTNLLPPQQADYTLAIYAYGAITVGLFLWCFSRADQTMGRS